MVSKISGRCLCGAVSYEGQVEPIFAAKCYCTECRKTSGTGHSAHLAVPKAAIRVNGPVTAYTSPADSGNLKTRAFCPTCGSSIYSVNEAMMPGAIFLRGSTLDDPELFLPQASVYASRAPSWDPVSTQIPAFATMPPRNG